VPSTYMRCMITANRRARATIAFFIPRRVDAIDVARRAPELIEIGPIGDQAAGVDEDTIVVDRGQLVAGRQLNDQVAMRPHPAAAPGRRRSRSGRHSERSACCALTANGHAAAAPPRAAKNSRRRTSSIG
jgi:hypothetical protein